MTNEITISEPVAHDIDNGCSRIIDDIKSISTQIEGVVGEPHVIQINERIASIQGETERIRGRILGHGGSKIGSAIKKIGGTAIVAVLVTCLASASVVPERSVVHVSEHGTVVPLHQLASVVVDVVHKVEVNGVVEVVHPALHVGNGHLYVPDVARGYVNHVVGCCLVHGVSVAEYAVLPNSSAVVHSPASPASPVLDGVCLPSRDVSQELVS